MIVRVHIIVEGLVQGVGFRWFVLRKAESMGLRGWVRNLYNGNVEIEAEGERGLLEMLISDVKVGPRSAQVTNLRIDWREPAPDEFSNFSVR